MLQLFINRSIPIFVHISKSFSKGDCGCEPVYWLKHICFWHSMIKFFFFFPPVCRLVLLWNHLLKVQCNFLEDLLFENCKIGGILSFMIQLFLQKLPLTWLRLSVLVQLFHQNSIDLATQKKTNRFVGRERLTVSVVITMLCSKDYAMIHLIPWI